MFLSKSANTTAPHSVLDARLRRHAATYDTLASTYHSLRFGDRYGRYDFEETQALIKDLLPSVLPASSAWRALDLACGTGKIAVTLGQLGGTVVALDAALGMLRQCSARSKEAGVEGKVTLTNASAGALPYKDGSFDVCFSFRFLHLLPVEAYAGILQEMVRVVKPGGYVVIEVRNRWYGGVVFRIKDLIKRIKRDPNVSSSLGVNQVRLLEREVDGISLQSICGLLLPKGWWLIEHPRLRRFARMQARKSLKGISAQLVAIYRKDSGQV
jgi:ubiquinone/menaquinone biosynthesis C-methylase UbiE